MLADAPLPHLNTRGALLRTSERDVLLILLAAAAGAADAWSYVGLGGAFVANMTGNTVLIGLSVFSGHDLAARLIALACYLPGVGLAAWLTRTVQPGALWSQAVSWTLLLEGALLSGAEAGWSALHHGPRHAAVSIPALLAIVAFSVGMQSGAMLQLEIPGIVTTYITGTWTNLISGIATFTTHERGKPAIQRRRFEERLLMQSAVVVAYLAAAVLIAWLARSKPGVMGLVPASAVLLSGAYGLARPTS